MVSKTMNLGGLRTILRVGVNLAPVVQNHHPLDSAIGPLNIHLLDIDLSGG